MRSNPRRYRRPKRARRPAQIPGTGEKGGGCIEGLQDTDSRLTMAQARSACPCSCKTFDTAFACFASRPGFALVAVLALAFGIGVNSAIFTLLNAIALRPLPVYKAGEVVTVYQVMQGLRSRNVHGSRAFFSYPEYAAYRDQNHVFTGLAAHASTHLALGGAGSRRLSGFVVSCNYFSLLAPHLHMGRGFLPSECGAPRLRSGSGAELSRSGRDTSRPIPQIRRQEHRAQSRQLHRRRCRARGLQRRQHHRRGDLGAFLRA